MPASPSSLASGKSASDARRPPQEAGPTAAPPPAGMEPWRLRHVDSAQSEGFHGRQLPPVSPDARRGSAAPLAPALSAAAPGRVRSGTADSSQVSRVRSGTGDSSQVSQPPTFVQTSFSSMPGSHSETFKASQGSVPPPRAAADDATSNARTLPPETKEAPASAPTSAPASAPPPARLEQQRNTVTTLAPSDGSSLGDHDGRWSAEESSVWTSVANNTNNSYGDGGLRSAATLTLPDATQDHSALV